MVMAYMLLNSEKLMQLLHIPSLDFIRRKHSKNEPKFFSQKNCMHTMYARKTTILYAFV